MNQNLKKDIPWVNVAKAICMLFVYFSHSEIYLGLDMSYFHKFYFPFNNNIFFFITGYFLIEKQLRNECISLSRYDWFFSKEKFSGKNMLSNLLFKVAIPTVIFSSILFVPKIIIRGEEGNWGMFVHDTILGGSIWFTSALTVAQVMLFLLLLLRNRSYTFYVLSSLFLLLVAVYFAKDSQGEYGTNNIPWFWKGGFVATLYIVLGAVYRKYECIISSPFLNKPYVTFLCFGVYGIIIKLFYNLMNISVNIGLVNVYGFIASIVGIVLMTEVAKIVPTNKFIQYIGRHTLVLYFLSGAIPSVLSFIALRYFSASITINIIVALLSFLLALPINYIINKYFSFLLDLRLLRHKN